MKRIFTLLCAAMLVGQAWAQTTFTKNNLEYTVTDGTNHYVSVGKTETRPTGDLEIMDTVSYEGVIYTVTSIASSGFYGCNKLTSITLPGTITSIGFQSFYNCNQLTEFTIPSAVTSIGKYAFRACSSLTSITIPSGVSSIGDFAFESCSGLTVINVESDNATYCSIDGVLFKKKNTYLTLIQYPSSKADTEYNLPDNVSSIENKAFYGCEYLASINVSNSNRDYYSDNGVLLDINKRTLILYPSQKADTAYSIPNTVEIVLYKAFYQCQNLKSLIIPKSVTDIDDYGIHDCTNLTINCCAASKPSGWLENWSYNVANVVWDYDPNAKKWTVTLLVNNNSFGSVSGGGAVKDSSTVIIEAIPYGGCAFVKWSNGLTSDKEAIFVTSDTTIVAEFKSTGNFNFEITSDTTVEVVRSFDFGSDVVIPETVEIEGKTYSITSIGYDSFAGCGWIESVIIPQTVTSIGSWAFFCCEKLSSIVIPNSVISIGDTAFAQTGLTTVIFGDSLRNIGKYAFGRCAKLTSITIPNEVKAIEEHTFYGCSSLTSVVIGESVKRIGVDAFRECSNLKTVIIGDSVTDIGDGACSRCGSLTSVVIGESVESIGEDAFNYCSSLTSIVIGESVENVGEYAFCRCDSLSSVIIKSDINIPYNSNLWIKKDGVQYNVKNKNTVSVDSDIWDDYDYSGDIIIPETVIAGDTFNIKSIGSYAFSYDSITSITIPNSVTEIGEAAFSHCRCLTSITIPNSVVSIGGWVFPNCSSLTEINVESGNTEYVSVDGVLFNKDKTILISYPAGKTGEYTIPSSVKEIATHAFSGCNDSTTVIIPKTVRTVDYYAFYDCAATINCMVNEKPNGWDDGWCGYDEDVKAVVVWGYKPTPVTETAANAVNIYAHGNTIVVENATDEISVYDAMGRLVCRDVARHVSTVAESGIRAEIRVNNPGLYIVKVGDVAKRVVVK